MWGCKMAMIYSMILTANRNDIKLQRSIGKYKCDWGDVFICIGTSVIPHQSPFPWNNQWGIAKHSKGWGALKACLFHSHAVGSLWCHRRNGELQRQRSLRPRSCCQFSHSLTIRPENKPINLWASLILGSGREANKCLIFSLYGPVGTTTCRVIT